MDFNQLVEKFRAARDTSPQESGEYIANEYLYSRLKPWLHAPLTGQRSRVAQTLNLLNGIGGINACCEGSVRRAYAQPMQDMQAWLFKTRWEV